MMAKTAAIFAISALVLGFAWLVYTEAKENRWASEHCRTTGAVRTETYYTWFEVGNVHQVVPYQVEEMEMVCDDGSTIWR